MIKLYALITFYTALVCGVVFWRTAHPVPDFVAVATPTLPDKTIYLDANLTRDPNNWPSFPPPPRPVLPLESHVSTTTIKHCRHPYSFDDGDMDCYRSTGKCTGVIHYRCDVDDMLPDSFIEQKEHNP